MQSLSSELVAMLSNQAHLEMQTSLLYLHYSYWFDNNGYEGIGTYFKAESEEERKHSIQIFDYLNARGYKIKINSERLLFGPNIKLEFQKPGEIFEQFQARETFNYTELEKLAKFALKNDQDPHTISFLNLMLDAQIKSCGEVDRIYAMSKAYSAVPGLFYHLDKQLFKKDFNFDTWMPQAKL